MFLFLFYFLFFDFLLILDFMLLPFIILNFCFYFLVEANFVIFGLFKPPSKTNFIIIIIFKKNKFMNLKLTPQLLLSI